MRPLHVYNVVEVIRANRPCSYGCNPRAARQEEQEEEEEQEEVYLPAAVLCAELVLDMFPKRGLLDTGDGHCLLLHSLSWNQNNPTAIRDNT